VTKPTALTSRPITARQFVDLLIGNPGASQPH
jgi:hypothetical protein